MASDKETSLDARVEGLWRILDTRKEGQLDLNGLRKGLRKMDHPLKNADHLLREVLEAVDTNGDGKIEYDEFRTFVETTENQLRGLFNSIDRDRDGKLDKEELSTAFTKAGLTVSKAKLDQFFAEVDTNHDGVISFDEWRNFLLFIPVNSPGLKAVLTYYSSTVLMNPEGDVAVSDETIEGLGYFLAGGIAGAISRSVTAPLDRLKVYLIAQTGAKSEAVKAVKEGATAEAAKKAARPLIGAMKELWKAGGMRSLFAGNGLNVLKIMPESAIKFGSYEGAKRALARLEGHSDPQQIRPVSKFVAGGLGGMVSQLFVYPIDTLKFRMQCETVEGGLHGNRLLIATAKQMWSAGGLHTFYRGLPMGLFGMFPYAAIDLGTFEYLKRLIISHNARVRGCHEDDVHPSSVVTAGIGAFSGALGASTVYPLNLLRTRLQTQGTTIHPPRYTGIMDVTRRTISNEGFRGLFKGITPNLLKVAPAVSITYVVYENSKKLLGLK
ncbi:mitochondrial carrier [Xylona heveae TC161]|uniref:Mitochondrial thiamine pyrophosphate carrier 1 n=1 Tax=Xylona heveae (strain CBS 132557 / TC161) TaxID=1328760 RepID=A0A164ZQ45_XYLHT|nr:mitochondrial carrier [Xylona heveae TC161]KZF19365.1 mitochondrial carrier [Xylona heveae TC161]